MLAMATGKKTPNRAKGALTLAAQMTPEERAARAEKAALARWGRPMNATHRGNFKEHFGVDAECYVLDDHRKTAVLTQRGISSALGLANPGGKDFERLLSRKGLSKHLGAALLSKIAQPVEFKQIYPGAKQASIIIKGYAADVLIEVCLAILAADAAGDLHESQAKLVTQARIITGASAKSGITNLVYALAGYNPSAQEIIQAFKAFVQEEAKKYEAEFPNELYEAWMKLYSIPKPVRGKPWKAMHLTRRHIYFPLAQSNGKVYDLLKALKAKGGDQKTKLFQFLNDIGARALRMQIGRVLEMAQSSKTPTEYEGRIIERFGGQQELELVLPTEVDASA
jgi:hypothetical protein